jgi:hypothetical protein
MNRRILWTLAALAVLVACDKTQEDSVVSQLSPVVEGESHVLTNMFSLFKPATGDPVTLRADFGGTRAHIDMNAEGTYAEWVWKAGDTFRMFAVDGSSYTYSQFSTEESGALVEFSTQNSISADPPFYAVFPVAGKISLYEGQPLFGVNIPAEQEAVSGGIKDGYTVAYATMQNTTDFIHFQSMVSLVRFRMSGSVVSKVKTVTIKGAGQVAGDIVILVKSDGSPELIDDIWFTSDSKSQTVMLTGDFVAGQDYYLVVKPGTLSRFQMVFADEEGNSTTKTANNFTFPQSRISDFGTIDLGEAFEDKAIDYEPILYMTASAGAPKPVTIAVVPDGFRKEEMSVYEDLAKSGIDALMDTEPYKSYSQYFNVWILRAASKQSGASVTDGYGNIVTLVDNYFGTKWGQDSYNDMTADSDFVFEFVSEHCPDIQDGTHTIAEVPILIIINDERYGGRCLNYSNGQGYGMVPYTDRGGGLFWPYPDVASSTDDPLPTPVDNDVLNAYFHWTTDEERSELGNNTGDWRNTLVHEFGGHCFGRLGDEYWPNDQLSYVSGPVSSQSWPVPFALNLASNPTAVPWEADVLDYPLESLVAKDPNYGRIGIFQGGDNKTYGRWRSEKVSCMIDNRFYFSTWQRMLIVKRIMTLSGSTFDATSFWQKDVTLDPVRDMRSSPVVGDQSRPVRNVPLLPPPVLYETH